MSTLTERIIELQERVAKSKSDYDKAQGALDSIKKELKAKGYNNLKELSADIEAKEAQAAEIEAKINADVEAWKEQYGHLISE